MESERRMPMPCAFDLHSVSINLLALMDVDLCTTLQAPELNDVLFTFPDGKTLACNRFMLAARSPVFRAMLFGHMMEANSDNPKVSISDFSRDAFTHFIRFVYTEHIDEDVDIPLVHQILLLSRKYCFTHLQRICEERIHQKLSPQNAGTYCLEAYTNGDFELVPMCLHIIAGSFAKTPASEINKLPLDCMKLLVQADETKSNEMGITQACLAWSQSRRQEDIHCLIPLIRFQNMTPEQFVKHVVPSALLHPEQMLEIMVAGVCGNLIRKPRQQTQSVFVMGNDCVFELHSDAGSWTRLPSMNVKRSQTSGCVCRGVLYCVGGDEHRAYMPSTETLDLTEKDKWVMAASMSQGRCFHTVCSTKGRVYAIGGIDKIGYYLATVSAFDPDTGRWSTVSPMITSRYHCSAAVLNHTIFVTGGNNGWPLSCVECYDPDSDSWSTISPMAHERYVHASCAFGGKLFVFGGYAHGRLDSAECYDPATSRWTDLAPMPVPRSRHGCAVWGDSIIVCGGSTDGGGALDSCDIYHPSSNTWEHTPFTLPMALADFAICGDTSS